MRRCHVRMATPNRSGSSGLILSCLGLGADELRELQLFQQMKRSSADSPPSTPMAEPPGRAPSPPRQTLQVRIEGAGNASGGVHANPQHVSGLVLLG